MAKGTSRYPYSPSLKKLGTSKDAALEIKPKAESIRNKALGIIKNNEKNNRNRIKKKKF